MMRYTEQIKYSWGYHWSISREVWDMMTLGKWCWFIVGLLVVFCIAPSIFYTLTAPVVIYYTTTPAPSLSQELAIIDYYWRMGGEPPFLWVFNYFWVESSEVEILGKVLIIASIGLLAAAYLREN